MGCRPHIVDVTAGSTFLFFVDRTRLDGRLFSGKAADARPQLDRHDDMACRRVRKLEPPDRFVDPIIMIERIGCRLFAAGGGCLKHAALRSMLFSWRLTSPLTSAGAGRARQAIR